MTDDRDQLKASADRSAQHFRNLEYFALLVLVGHMFYRGSTAVVEG
jgi:hypothetical protein